MENQKNHQYFLEEAVKESFLAIESKEGEPFGCVVVKDG